MFYRIYTKIKIFFQLEVFMYLERVSNSRWVFEERAERAPNENYQFPNFINDKIQ